MYEEKMQYAQLSNGVKMPLVGLGVMRVQGEDCTRYVKEALEVGYRLIDTAKSYFNEEYVGKAIEESLVPREEIFLTTKLWITNAGYENAKAAIADSLEKLRTNYIDLVIIHMCSGDYYGTYRAMLEYYDKGAIRALGISNFGPERMVDMCLFNRVPPMVNQVETNLFFQQHEFHQLMGKYNIHHEAWGPLAQERVMEIVNHPLLKQIGEKYGKTATQVALRHTVQRGITIIPKSDSRGMLIQNIDLFDFSLTDEEMAQVTALDEKVSLKSDYGNYMAAEYAASELRGDKDKMFN